MSRQIFVNLPIKNMERSKAFFSALGFSFNPQFTNEQGACMVISDSIYAMLLIEPFFQTFTRKPVADATKSTEVLICLSCESRAEVDSLERTMRPLTLSLARESSSSETPSSCSERSSLPITSHASSTLSSRVPT